MPEGRPSRRRIFLILGTTLVVIFVAPWLWLQVVTASKWSDMERRVAFLLEEQAKRDPSRPVLRGEPLPGDAFEDYGLALPLLERVSGNPIWGFFNRRDDADPELVRKAVKDYAEAIRLLQRGARRRTAQNPRYRRTVDSIPTDGILRTDHGDLEPPMTLAVLAACRARLDQDSDRRSAIELLLDVLQFSRDSWHNGSMADEIIGFNCARVALLELHDLVVARSVPAGTMAEVARELGILDESFPRRDFSLLNGVALMGACFLKGNIEGKGSPGTRVEMADRTWRYGFSRRLGAADGFSRINHWHQLFIDANAGTWEHERDTELKFVNSASDSPTWFFEGEAVGTLSVGRFWRKTRAQLRLLRIAAHFLATGEVPPLKDPFGDQLRHTLQDGVLRVWSLGIRGQDFGGEGDFADKKTSKSGEPLNIVIEVRR